MDITILDHQRIEYTFEYSSKFTPKIKQMRKLLRRQNIIFRELCGAIGEINSEFCEKYEHNKHIPATRFITLM